MTYDCMTPDELALWQRSGKSVPCYDCPAWFRDEARQRGCCRSQAGVTSRHRLEQMAAATRRYRERRGTL